MACGVFYSVPGVTKAITNTSMLTTKIQAIHLDCRDRLQSLYFRLRDTVLVQRRYVL